MDIDNRKVKHALEQSAKIVNNAFKETHVPSKSRNKEPKKTFFTKYEKLAKALHTRFNRRALRVTKIYDYNYLERKVLSGYLIEYKNPVTFDMIEYVKNYVQED